MPAIFVGTLYYNKTNDEFSIPLYSFVNKFDLIKDGSYIQGKLDMAMIDKTKQQEIDKDVQLRLAEQKGIFDGQGKELIKQNSINPNSYIVLILNTYSDSISEYTTKYPIYSGYFELIEVPDQLKGYVESKFKGQEEILKLIELDRINTELKESFDFLKEANSSFKLHRFPDTKSNLRKSLEIIRKSIQPWETIDESAHLSEGIKKLTDKLYSLASTGGSHPGKASLDDTNLLLRCILSLFKYVNDILNEGRIKIKIEEKNNQ